MSMRSWMFTLLSLLQIAARMLNDAKVVFLM